MRKINQALGRLVRGPGQHARVLLHCRRFADPSYQRLLDPVFLPGETISTPAQLMDWLSAPVE
jgi:Rad3-related DNA helicase